MRSRSARGPRVPARAGGDRRLVRFGLDAVRAMALPVRTSTRYSRRAFPPTSSARRSTRRAAGSTACTPSRRCCSTSRHTRMSICLGHVVDATRREDEQEQGQRHRSLRHLRRARRRRAALVLLHRQSAGRGKARVGGVGPARARTRLFNTLWNTRKILHDVCKRGWVGVPDGRAARAASGHGPLGDRRSRATSSGRSRRARALRRASGRPRHRTLR